MASRRSPAASGHVAVVVLTVHAYRADSNLWPIYLILVSIPAAGYLLILFFAERHTRSRA